MILNYDLQLSKQVWVDYFIFIEHSDQQILITQHPITYYFLLSTYYLFTLAFPPQILQIISSSAGCA